MVTSSNSASKTNYYSRRWKWSYWTSKTNLALFYQKKKKKKKFEINQELIYVKFNKNKNNVIKDVTDNVKICRYFYDILYNLVAENFFDLVSLVSFQKIKHINEDIWLNSQGLNSNIRQYASSTKLLRSINFFSYLNTKFPFEKKLVHVPGG